MTCFWKDFLPSTPADRTYHITVYGPKLQANKALLTAACCGKHTCILPLLLAMAMLETTTLCVDDRDCSKDGTLDGSVNCSMFNLSEDLLRYIGYKGRVQDLNLVSNLPVVVAQMHAGITKVGVERFLNYVRGGRSAFIDGSSYGAGDYRSTIATMLSVFDKLPSLLMDDRRVDINLVHV